MRTVPLLLFDPELLGNPFGHLATALPMLFVFLMVFGITVYRRSNNVIYTVSVMGLFCILPGMIHPLTGFAPYWLDLHAALLGGAAALCLLNYSDDFKVKWIIGFSILASMATLSRYISGVVLFIMCAPLLVVYLYKNYDRGRSIGKNLLFPIILMLGVISLFSGGFIVYHLNANISFYTIYGYAINNDSPASLIAAGNAVKSFFFWGKKGFLGFAFLYILVILLNLFSHNIKRLKSSLPLIWLAVASPLFILLIKSTDARSVVYSMPFVFMLMVSPFPYDALRAKTPKKNLNLLFLTIVFLMSVIISFKFTAYAKKASLSEVQKKQFDVKLASQLVKLKRKIVWNVFFDEYAWIPSMEAFYMSGTLPLPAGQRYYNAHESAWKGDYPGLSPVEIVQRIYNSSCKWLDVVVVYRHPADAEKNKNMRNDTSRFVAKEIARRVRTDFKNWKLNVIIPSLEYGEVAVYENRKIPKGHYELFLRNDPRIQP